MLFHRSSNPSKPAQNCSESLSDMITRRIMQSTLYATLTSLMIAETVPPPFSSTAATLILVSPTTQSIAETTKLLYVGLTKLLGRLYSHIRGSFLSYVKHKTILNSHSRCTIYNSRSHSIGDTLLHHLLDCYLRRPHIVQERFRWRGDRPAQPWLLATRHLEHREVPGAARDLIRRSSV